VKRKIPIIATAIAFILLALIGCSTAKIPGVGDKAPDFTLESIDGKKVSLSDFHGKVVLIILTSVNCKDCERQMPHIQAAYDQASEKPIVLSIYRFNAVGPVKNYVSEMQYTTFPALPDLKDTVAPKYGIGSAPPASIFIDPEGIIKYKKIGPFQSQQEIEDILKSL
jgi:peroxiredoxin